MREPAAGATAASKATHPPIAFRRATEADIPVCATIWRTALNAYLVPLNQPEAPDDLTIIQRLYRHLHATDPERFVVATADERVVGFAVATIRDRVWFLSMLFVLPEAQARGLGRALLERVLPADTSMIRATATDSAQPISNALYASFGIVPRVPLLSFLGLPQRFEAFGHLPGGVVPVPFRAVVERGADGHRELATTVDALDRELLGFTHAVDHRFLREQERHGWLYYGPDGGPLGYGYSGESGRVGPILVRDPALVAPVLGHVLAAVQPRGAFITWIPGSADRAVVAALRSGLRLEPFPVLLCWDRPPADFARYLPISPGLL